MGQQQNIPHITSKYLEAAKAAVIYTRKVMDIGASNKVAPWDFYGKFTKALCAGTAISKGYLQEQIDKDMSSIPEPTYKEYVDVMASWARQIGCGNCGPHSAVAFVYLRDNLKISPLDWIMYNDFQHAFVIVGRLSDTSVTDFTTWKTQPFATHGADLVKRSWYSPMPICVLMAKSFSYFIAFSRNKGGIEFVNDYMCLLNHG